MPSRFEDRWNAFLVLPLRSADVEAFKHAPISQASRYGVTARRAALHSTGPDIVAVAKRLQVETSCAAPSWTTMPGHRGVS